MATLIVFAVFFFNNLYDRQKRIVCLENAHGVAINWLRKGTTKLKNNEIKRKEKN